jgi:hypothetical protein
MHALQLLFKQKKHIPRLNLFNDVPTGFSYDHQGINVMSSHSTIFRFYVHMCTSRTLSLLCDVTFALMIVRETGWQIMK